MMQMLVVWGPYYENLLETGYYVIIKKEKWGGGVSRSGKGSQREGHEMSL